MSNKPRWIIYHTVIAAGLFVASLLPAFELTAAEADSGLFAPARADQVEKQASPSTGPRSRLVQVDFRKLTTSDTLRLNLFEDVIVVADPVRIDPTASGKGYEWVGKVKNQAQSRVSLVVREGILAGHIRTTGQDYELIPAAGGLVLIRQAGSEAIEELENDAVYPPDDDRRSAAGAPRAPVATEDGSAIDIMVAFTQQARLNFGGTAATRTWIDAMIAYANDAYENSMIGTRLNLVHTVEVSDNVSEDAGTNLYDITDAGDGIMDSLHVLRDQYHADLVQLISKSSGGSCSGIAWVMNDWGGDPEYAFSAHAGTCFSVSVHELGHNQGATHDWYVTGPSWVTYNHGFVDRDCEWRTLMAYGNECSGEPRIQFFSNPNVVYQHGPGDTPSPTGIAAGSGDNCEGQPLSDCDADAARLLNETAVVIANYRLRPPEPLRPFCFPVKTAPGVVKWICLRSSGVP